MTPVLVAAGAAGVLARYGIGRATLPEVDGGRTGTALGRELA